MREPKVMQELHSIREKMSILPKKKFYANLKKASVEFASLRKQTAKRSKAM